MSKWRGNKEFSKYKIPFKGKDYNIRIFDFSSRREMERYVEEKSKNLDIEYNKKDLARLNKRPSQAIGDSWYGFPLIEKESDLTEHSQYLHFDLLKKIRPRIKGEIENLNLLESEYEVKKKKIEYNDREIGIFSFDRASMGLRKIKKDGETKIISDIKKSYAYFIPKSTAERTVKLYIHAGGNGGVGGKEMVYSGIASSVLVELLVEAGFDVEVNMIIGTIDSPRRKVIWSIAKVKKFHDELNMNDLMLLSSSPRYYRYKGFKNIIVSYDSANVQVPGGLGISSFDNQLKKEIIRTHRKGEARAILMDRAYSEDAVINVIKKVFNEFSSNTY